MKTFLTTLLSALILSACATLTISSDMVSAADKAKLASIIAARSDEEKARDTSRNPQQTLEFFGITPDMAVAEVLPGGGWYTKILAPYLAEDGELHAINYSNETWPMFGFFSEEQIAERAARIAAFPETVAEFAGQPVKSSGMSFGRLNQSVEGTLDAILFIRALHNLQRFEERGGTMSQAITDTAILLKTGGIVGVVQHQAAETKPDEWTDGSNGYLKKSMLVAMFDKAGFDLVGESMVNANPKDLPGENDVVWRLPPTLNTGPLEGEAKEAAKAANKAIGESNRMTLKFIKR